METVIVVSFNEDGDVPLVYQMSKEEFLKKLNADHWGHNPNFAKDGNIDTENFAGLLVIKGEVVQPKAVDVVKQYDL